MTLGTLNLKKNVLDLENKVPINKESYFNFPDQYWSPELLICYSKWLLEMPDPPIPEVEQLFLSNQESPIKSREKYNIHLTCCFSLTKCKK